MPKFGGSSSKPAGSIEASGDVKGPEVTAPDVNTGLNVDTPDMDTKVSIDADVNADW